MTMAIEKLKRSTVGVFKLIVWKRVDEHLLCIIWFDRAITSDLGDYD